MALRGVWWEAVIVFAFCRLGNMAFGWRLMAGESQFARGGSS